jgi:dihydroorotate dehydrogenase
MKGLSGPPIRDVSLHEMLEAMAHLKDEETFRWFQTSIVGQGGVPQAADTLRVSMGQARREVLGSHGP